MQDAVETRPPPEEQCRTWVKYLHPFLYKLLDGPERRFVMEELLLVNDGVELASFISNLLISNYSQFSQF
ncbi:unnamed protein product [Rhizophagus irregularis]|nr:unnamed protein product [Rhizophagus irregularis]CAB4411580.1 unnamed protein product [Rhizophagus irregularis]